MTKTEESGPNEEPAEENSSRDHGSWKRVDPKIWSRRERRSGLSAKISSIPTWLGWALTSTVFFVFVLAPLGGLSAYLTILIAFYFGGLRFFGFYFIGIWAAIIVGFVVIVEKTGYSKNFASWDFPLRRVVFVPVGFAIVMGAFLLMMFLTGFLHR